MYELIQAGKNTYYIDCPAKIGIYTYENGDALLIDSGNDKEAAKKIIKILEERHLRPTAILNTHSNADHMGGNATLRQRLSCPCFAKGMERAFIESPILETSFLYGGYPFRELRNKFLLAEACECRDIDELTLPDGFELLSLPGHFFDMIGVRTPDGVWFLADCLAGGNILEKYHISFIYDVKQYLATLDQVEQLSGTLFVPSHAAATEDITPVVKQNREKVEEITSLLLNLCKTPIGFEEILKKVFDTYALVLDANQFVLAGSTIRSYLSYLKDKGQLEFCFTENKMLWFSQE